jgi:hypothetical protein
MAAIRSETFLKKIVNYSTEDAIKMVLLVILKLLYTNYKLNSTIPVQYGKVKKWKNTELAECLRMSKQISKAFATKCLLPPNRMRFINSTNSLIMLIDGLLKIK